MESKSAQRKSKYNKAGRLFQRSRYERQQTDCEKISSKLADWMEAYRWRLMMIDSDTLRYYIDRELFMRISGEWIKFFIFNLKESLDE